MQPRVLVVFLVVGLAVLLSLSCGIGIDRGRPSEPTPRPVCCCCTPVPTSPTAEPTRTPIFPTPTSTATRPPFRPTATSTPPPVTPTSAPTPTPTPTAGGRATPTPTTFATPSRIDPSVVCTYESSQNIYKYVKQAILDYQKAHPDQFHGNNLAPAFWDQYYFGVTTLLNQGGWVQAVVDDCGGAGICGEIAAKSWGTSPGTSFHEQYHILTSGGDIRYTPDSYRATCRPAGF